MRGLKLIGYYNYTVIATYAGLLAAAYGIVSALRGDVTAAVYCLFFAGFVDTFDGKIAQTRRRTDREKAFGIQIDSLCDLVSFGVLPGCIGFAAGCSTPLGVAVICLYILCALIRLAYFNVDEAFRQQETDARRAYYEGLPVTSAALLFPMAYALRDLIGGVFPTVYGALLAVVAAAFVAGFRVRKPGKVGLLIFFAVGLAELALILFLR